MADNAAAGERVGVAAGAAAEGDAVAEAVGVEVGSGVRAGVARATGGEEEGGDGSPRPIAQTAASAMTASVTVATASVRVRRWPTPRDPTCRWAGTGDGTPLFAEDGKATQALTQALGLAEDYRTAALRSDEFCDTLQAMGLLRSVTLDVKQTSGESSVVHGLLVLDEEAFDALSPENLAKLHAEKWLKPLMAHLVSLSAIVKLSPAVVNAS